MGKYTLVQFINPNIFFVAKVKSFSIIKLSPIKKFCIPFSLSNCKSELFLRPLSATIIFSGSIKFFNFKVLFISNLKTMEVDLNNTLKLKNFINPDKIIVAESGLKNNLDLQLLKENGIQNFLIGESLMREKDLTLATKKILGLMN